MLAKTDAATLRGFLAVPACRVAWLINRELMNGDYRDHVDALVGRTKAQVPPVHADERPSWTWPSR